MHCDDISGGFRMCCSRRNCHHSPGKGRFDDGALSSIPHAALPRCFCWFSVVLSGADSIVPSSKVLAYLQRKKCCAPNALLFYETFHHAQFLADATAQVINAQTKDQGPK